MARTAAQKPLNIMPVGCVPIRQAPFYAVYEAIENGNLGELASSHILSLVNNPWWAGLFSLSSALRNMSGAAWANVDPKRAIFEVRFPIEPDEPQFIEYAPRAFFHPEELLAEREAVLCGLTVAQQRATLNAVEILWPKMLRDLESAVDARGFEIYARVRSALEPNVSKIDGRLLRNFVICDWERGNAVCEETGERLFDIHVLLNRDNRAASPGGMGLERMTSLLRAELQARPKFDQKEARHFVWSLDPSAKQPVIESVFREVTGHRKPGRPRKTPKNNSHESS